MVSEKDNLLQREHYEDLLHDAERERIIRQALGQNRPVRLHERALAWLGHQFVVWCCHLQRRYAFRVFDGKEATFHDLAAATSDCDYVS